MAKEGKKEERQNKRGKKEESSSPSSSSAPSSGRQVTTPTTDYRGSGEFDQETGLAQTLQTGQMIPRNHFANEDEWAEYFAKVPQEIKRAHREGARANQERVYAGMADGMSLADLGVTDEKEHGRALYRRLTSYGLLDPNFEYDWASGMKRNVGTSDLGARSRYTPISESERREHEEQKRYGGDFARRINTDAGNRMNQAVNNGTFTRDPVTGLLYNDPQNDSSRRQYYDDRGYFIDPNTRQRTGGGHTGHVYGGNGGMGGGQAVFGGVGNGNAWGTKTTTPVTTPNSTPLNPGSLDPYYRPPTNPWGSPETPSHQTQTFGGGTPQSSSPFAAQSNPIQSPSLPMATSPFAAPDEVASASPWRKRRTFGAPA